MNNIKIIGFDADDTLWENIKYFTEAQNVVAEIFADRIDHDEFIRTLYQTEMNNMPIYGYGAKAYILSLIETARKLSKSNLTVSEIDKIIMAGKQLLSHPVVLLDGVAEIISCLHKRYPLIVITKGDLKEQERKFYASGLSHFFERIEVFSNKKTENYVNLFNDLNIDPSTFLMVGDSMKSDIIPTLKAGAKAVYIPYHTQWQHEVCDLIPENTQNYYHINNILELKNLIINPLTT